MRAWVLVAVIASSAFAPLQCTRKPAPERAIVEDPAEALYELAEQFRAQGDERARKVTLRRIVERYPSSRFAHMAREDLGLPADQDGEPPGQASVPPPPVREAPAPEAGTRAP